MKTVIFLTLLMTAGMIWACIFYINKAYKQRWGNEEEGIEEQEKDRNAH